VATPALPEQLLKAGIAYSTRMASISLRLARTLLPDLGPVTRAGVVRALELRRDRRPGTAPETAISAEGRRSADGQGLLRIEAEGGAVGYGVFMVENRGNESVTTELEVSAFRAGSGRAVRPPVSFEPARLTLAPGEQALVQVGVTVRTTWAAGRAYDATISLPGLEGATIPITVSRRP
jgi:hypothetical protein